MLPNDRFPIVGIGASAGGVEALQSFFRAVPADSGMAFVVVTHLGDQKVSVLDDILARCTTMPVVHAESGTVPQRGHAYVLPSGAIMTLAGGRLRLRKPNAKARERNPIDIFFASLAQDQGEYAIGVVLSGGGHDGTLGIKAIKEQGGLTLAQGSDQSTPRHTGMPSSAIASGLVDLVVPVEDMPAKLVEYARGFGALQALTAEEGDRRRPDSGASIHQTICAILRNQVGHDFSGYKARTFLRRVQRRMQVQQLTDVDVYVERLRQQPDEVTLLFRDLLIGVTSFFRDTDAFEALQRHVIPRLFEGKKADDRVRVWVPGCATGEEVYSLAMLMREHLDGLPVAPQVQIFATDIDEPALAVARGARYPAALLEDVPAKRLERFFTEDGGSHVLAKEVRDLCIFSTHSVIRDPPFSRVDLISCRNLLIYMSAELQAQVVPVFHYALRPGGFLFLGTSENVTQFAELFAPLEKKQRIFKRRDHVDAAVHFPLFLPDGRASSVTQPAAQRPGPQGLSLRHAVELRVLERFAPAYVVVNREGDVVYYSARTGKYLEPPSGAPTRQLQAMARKGLRLDLREALRAALETSRPVVRENVAIEIDDRVQLITLTIDPFDPLEGEPLFLVLFADAGPPLTPAEAAEHGRGPGEGDGAVESLERELRDARERLQSSIEEYEAALEELKSANEELVSVNEELQSTNEELETSKEELQSVNEELHTVNTELNVTLEDLDRANNDLTNLFDSTDIATVFLDRQLVIRSFTPRLTAIFHLIPGDRGRALTDIASRLRYPELRADTERLLASGRPSERRVSLEDGDAHYLARLLPYRTANGRIDGVVATFIDVTVMVAAEEHQRQLVAELNHRVKNMLTVISGIATLTLARTPEPKAFVEAFLGRLRALAHTCEALSRENWAEASLREIVLKELSLYALDDEHRVSATGPLIHLKPKVALSFGMVLHELATNAIKHGALSVPSGRVEVGWRLKREDAEERLVVTWHEHGGPPVAEPKERGFGSKLIERELTYGIDGGAHLEFAPDGLRATLTLPADRGLLSLDRNAR